MLTNSASRNKLSSKSPNGDIPGHRSQQSQPVNQSAISGDVTNQNAEASPAHPLNSSATCNGEEVVPLPSGFIVAFHRKMVSGYRNTAVIKIIGEVI